MNCKTPNMNINCKFQFGTEGLVFEAGLFLRAVFSKRRQHTLLHRNWAKARFPGHTNDDNEATKYEIPIQHTNTKTNTNYKRNKKRQQTRFHRNSANAKFPGLTEHDDEA